MYAYHVNPLSSLYHWYVSEEKDFSEQNRNNIVWAESHGLDCPYENGKRWNQPGQWESELASSEFRVSEMGKRKNLISDLFERKTVE